MNNMHAQRLVIIIAAAIAMLATFLPWANLGLITIPGTAGPDGIVNLGAFALCAVFAFLGDRKKPMHFALLCGFLLACMFPTGIAIAKYGLLGGQATRIGIGLYLIILAGTIAIVSSIVMAPQRRGLGIVLLVLSMPLMLFSLLGYDWWTVGEYGKGNFLEIGVLGYNICDYKDCHHEWFFFSGVGDSVEIEATTNWHREAIAVSILCFLTLVSNMFSAIAAAARYQIEAKLIGKVSLGLAVATFVGAVLFITDVTEQIDKIPMGSGSPLMILGTVLGALGGLSLARWDMTKRAHSSESASVEIEIDSSPVVPACIRCSAPTEFVPKHKRFYCSACKVYL